MLITDDRRRRSAMIVSGLDSRSHDNHVRVALRAGRVGLRSTALGHAVDSQDGVVLRRRDEPPLTGMTGASGSGEGGLTSSIRR